MIRKEGVLERINALRSGLAGMGNAPEPGIPDSIVLHLNGISDILKRDVPDMALLANISRAILWWCFDQGQKANRIHEDLYGLAVDLAKLGSLYELMRIAGSLPPNHLHQLPQTVSLLMELLGTFDADGRRNTDAYGALSARINALVEQDRPRYTAAFGYLIESI